MTRLDDLLTELGFDNIGGNDGVTELGDRIGEAWESSNWVTGLVPKRV